MSDTATGAISGASGIRPLGNHLRQALIVYVFLIIAMSYLDRVNLSIAGPTVQKEFGLADRLGPRRVLTFGMLWAGLFTALTGAVPAGSTVALPFLMAIRFTLGVG